VGLVVHPVVTTPETFSPPSTIPWSPEETTIRPTTAPRPVSSSTVPPAKNSTSSGCAAMHSARLTRGSPGPLKRLRGGNAVHQLRQRRRRDAPLPGPPQDRAGDGVHLGRLARRDVLLHRAAHLGRHRAQH